MSTEEGTTHKKYQYNISVDTISYRFDDIPGFKFILAEGDWLKTCLTNSELVELGNSKVIRFEGLQIAKSVQFYSYMGNATLKYFVRKEEELLGGTNGTPQNQEQLINAMYRNYGYGDGFL
jgi:hypothetical protein